MRSSQELKEAREAAGLSIADCCRLTGVARTTWQSWETDENMPNARRPHPLAFAWLELYRRLFDLGEL
jgi:transcriptional regulator with XRE-family HTH domain